MNILAVNGSPRGKHGNTEQLLQPFLKGARDAGAETEVIYLKDKKIEHCTGCYTCWGKTPGVCAHRDDMEELLEKRRQADVTVYATPLYVYTVTGLMKDFMDRSLPLAQPYITKSGDRYAHPRRYEDQKIKKAVLISNCGFPGRQYFTGLVETFRNLYSKPGNELAGAILCGAGIMLGIPEARQYIQWYLDACEDAGREVAQAGAISEQTQSVLERELIDFETYVNNANAYWDRTLAGQSQ